MGMLSSFSPATLGKQVPTRKFKNAAFSRLVFALRTTVSLCIGTSLSKRCVFLAAHVAIAQSFLSPGISLGAPAQTLSYKLGQTFWHIVEAVMQHAYAGTIRSMVQPCVLDLPLQHTETQCRRCAN